MSNHSFLVQSIPERLCIMHNAKFIDQEPHWYRHPKSQGSHPHKTATLTTSTGIVELPLSLVKPTAMNTIPFKNGNVHLKMESENMV